MPYLRIFGPDNNSKEVTLSGKRQVLGRSETADIQLEHRTVSREHAMIYEAEGQFTVEDLKSLMGIFVNGIKVKKAFLNHGDNIEISSFIMEFRTDDNESTMMMDTLSQHSRPNLRLGSYKQVPSSMQLRYRLVKCHPSNLFERGDTVKLADGGIIIPTAHTPPPQSTMEVEFLWPNGNKRLIMGELMAVLEIKPKLHAMCIKLHKLPREVHQRAIANSRCSDWVKCIQVQGT